METEGRYDKEFEKDRYIKGNEESINWLKYGKIVEELLYQPENRCAIIEYGVDRYYYVSPRSSINKEISELNPIDINSGLSSMVIHEFITHSSFDR